MLEKGFIQIHEIHIPVQSDAYKSFLIIVDKTSQDLSAFITPDKWPKGWVVREYYQRWAKAKKTTPVGKKPTHD